MRLLGKIEMVEKKSKFIGYYFEINDPGSVKKLLIDLRKEHKKARHIAYAYKVLNQIKKSDDKEPTNTAGTPILNIIEKKNLDNCLICVVRYYGGIRLGAGGLTRMYGKCANEVTKRESI